MHNQNLLLKAKDLGLDTLVMGIRDAGKLRELLSIGEDQDVAAGIREGTELVRQAGFAGVTTYVCRRPVIHPF